MKKILIVLAIILIYQLMMHYKGISNAIAFGQATTPEAIIEQKQEKKKDISHFLPIDTLVEGSAKSYIEVVNEAAPLTIGTSSYGYLDIGLTVRLKSIKPMAQPKETRGLFEPPPKRLIMELSLLTDEGDPVGVASAFKIQGVDKDRWNALIAGKIKQADIKFVYRQRKGDLTEADIRKSLLDSDARKYKVYSYK